MLCWVDQVIYVDTKSNYILYIDEADPNHEKAVELIKTLRDRRVVSRLTHVELISIFSGARLEEPAALALYSIRKEALKQTWFKWTSTRF